MTKEEVYDSQIAPLMAQIIEIVKREKIAMHAQFLLDETPEEALACTTHVPDDPVSPQIAAHLAVSYGRWGQVAKIAEDNRVYSLMMTTVS